MNDEFYIKRCIDLALKGKGNVAPNPMVGAVIVYNNEIIGEGYHQQYGEAHAEVNAVNAVADKSLLNESTIYVSLEPCAHFGKTPPCANLIVKYNFKRVVIGCVDTFSKVAGKGIEILKNAGIEVTIGVLEKECRALNKRFFTFHEKKRPYVILKWAQSKDGFLDKERNNNETGINWITQPETKKLVHQWRAEESAILVGKNTALTDNPSLTVREAKGKNPIRILLDSHLEVQETAHLFDEQAPLLIFNTIKSDKKGQLEWIKTTAMTPQSILSELHKRSIQSLIVEGGKKVLETFILANLWDEARVLVGTPIFERGIVAPQLKTDFTSQTKLGQDAFYLYKNQTIDSNF